MKNSLKMLFLIWEKKLKNSIGCYKCEDSPLKGYLYQDDFCKPCTCLIQYRKELKENIGLKSSSIPTLVKDLDFTDYTGSETKKAIEKLNKYIDKFKEKGFKKSLYLFGGNGTAKTSIAFLTGYKLIKKDISVKYIMMDKLVKYCQSVQFNEEYEIELQKLLNVDCLIVDECFDKTKVQLYNNTGFQIGPLTSFLKERMELLNKSIIFIANVSIEDIEKNNFSASLKDLVDRNTTDKVLTLNENFKAIQSEFIKEDLWDWGVYMDEDDIYDEMVDEDYERELEKDDIYDEKDDEYLDIDELD